MTARSRALRRGPHPKHPLQITTRTPRGPDFKFELLPLHSPLLRQSRLVSFPPLIDMLKFSGYPYLIRGQPGKIVGCFSASASSRPGLQERVTKPHTLEDRTRCRRCLSGPSPLGGGDDDPTHKPCLRAAMTLGQAYPPEYQGVQCAFKDSMIH